MAPKDIRAMLIKFYSVTGTIQDKAIGAGLDRRTFKRRLERAEYFVNSELDFMPIKQAHSRQHAVLAAATL